jgi:hypothetical protein
LRRGAGEACFGSADAGETMKLTEEEGVIAGLRKLEGEAAFGKYAKAAQVGMGRERARSGLRCGPARARLGRILRKNSFRIKIGFLNLPRLWKFIEGDLGEILT